MKIAVKTRHNYPYDSLIVTLNNPALQDISEEFLLEHYRSPGNEQRGSSDRYTSWPWRVTIKNCGGYFLYR
jgi:hypothetical protein